MPEETTQVAESSPAAVETQEARPMESWSDAEHATWLQKGEVPKPKEGESAPLKTSEQGAESEPAKEAQETGQPKEKPKQDAETRKKQLAAEIQELLDLRHRMREEVSQIGAKPPESPPGREAAQGADRPKRPKLDQFETYEGYEDALDKYEGDLANWAVGQRLNVERTEYARRQALEDFRQSQERIKSNWIQREKETIKRHPDFLETVKSAKDLPLNPIMDLFIQNSQIGPDLVLHLSKNHDEAERIARMDPFDTPRALTRLEDKLSEAIKSPARKTITDAKHPPTELSGTNKAADDEVEAALHAGDEGRYIEAMNARDIARLVRK